MSPEDARWRFYYNPHPPVEFGAWGLDVPVAWRGGGHTVGTGNSFAAPHITALVALMLSKHPGLTPFEVKAILAAASADVAKVLFYIFVAIFLVLLVLGLTILRR